MAFFTKLVSAVIQMGAVSRETGADYASFREEGVEFGDDEGTDFLGDRIRGDGPDEKGGLELTHNIRTVGCWPPRVFICSG